MGEVLSRSGCVEIEILLLFVIQSEAKDLGNILYVIEILPPYGRLNDKMISVLNFDTLTFLLLHQ